MKTLIEFALSRRKATGKGSTNVLHAAVIGLQRHGCRLATAFASYPDVVVRRLFDFDPLPKRLETVCSSIGAIQGVRPCFAADLDSVFDDPSVDLILVAAPNHWHSELYRRSIAAGKHIYLEKPMAHTREELAELVELDAASGLICQVGLQNRSNLAVQEISDRLGAGIVGTLRGAVVRAHKPRHAWRFNGQIPSGLDVNTWLRRECPSRFDPAVIFTNWRRFWVTGNGEMGNQAIHELDLALACFPALSPRRILSFGMYSRPHFEGISPETQLSFLTGGDGGIVVELSNRAEPSGEEVFGRFYGTEGTLTTVPGRAAIARDAEGREVATFEYRPRHHEDFLGAVRDSARQRPCARPAEVYHSHRVAEEANESLRRGVPVSRETWVAGVRERVADLGFKLPPGIWAESTPSTAATWIRGEEIDLRD